MLEINIKDLKIEKDVLIKNFKIKLKKGDVLNLKGNTGCGKTTLLKTILGIIPEMKFVEVKRSVRFNNEELNLDNIPSYFSYCAQEPENQFLFNNARNEIFSSLNSKKQIKIVKDLLKKFKMNELINKSLKDLSAGQRKMISLIATLSTDKEIILLDEPLANLDRGNKVKLREFLEVFKENKIIICADHDIVMEDFANKKLYFNDKNKTWGNKSTSKTPFKNNKINSENKKDLLIKMKNVNYKYPDNTSALKNINMELYKNNIVGIVGKNGSGKTTLIKLILNIIRKNRGEITRNIKDYCYIHQEPDKQIFTNTVFEELKFENEKNIDVVKLAEKINLSLKLNEHPLFLSRGQKQILLVQSAIARESDLLVIDEPFSGLDTKKIKITKKLIKDLQEKTKNTIILTEQEDNEIIELCSKIIYIENGNLVNMERYDKIKDQNISVLVIKPEANKLKKKIINELIKRNYLILFEKKLDNFLEYLPRIYGQDYPNSKKIKTFVEAYKENIKDLSFFVLVVKHKKYNTISLLNNEIGHFINYQKEIGNSLRSLFGKSARFNYKKNGFVIVFNALHRANNIEDVQEHLDLFKIRDNEYEQ